MEYIKSANGWEEDGLLGGVEIPTEIYNVSLSAETSVSRGDLLCGDSFSGVFAPVGGASDASKVLVIAAENFTADSLHSVTQAYVSGKFNREKITFAGNSSVDISDFENEMRKQNLHLTGIKE